MLILSMLQRCILALICLFLLGATPVIGNVTVEKIAYHGWPNSYRISNGTVQLIVLTDVGPRIIFYGFAGGENEFHEFPEQLGQTGGSEYKTYGGHRLWVSPEVERTYYPDNSLVRMVRNGDAFVFAAPVEATPPGTNLQKEMEIRLSKSGTQVTVIHRITNRGAASTEMAPWGISSMGQGGRSILPLPPKASWSKDRLLPEGVISLWSYTDFADPRWMISTKYVQLKQDPNPKGPLKEQMTGIYDPAGWIAYFRSGHLFVTRVDVEKGSRYPDNGCNFETYTEPGFLELETLGPMRLLEPGKTATHIEQWLLFKDIPDGKGDDWIDQVIVPRVTDRQ